MSTPTYLEFVLLNSTNKILVEFSAIDAVIESTDGYSPHSTIVVNGSEHDVNESYAEVVSKLNQVIRGY